MSEEEEDRRRVGGRRASDKQPLEELVELCEGMEERHLAAMEAMEERHREEMRSLARQVRQARTYIGTLFIITFLSFVGGAWFLKHEADVREDGQCRIFEGDQQAEREELADTYAYLAGAQLRGPESTDTQLYEFALARLPQTIEKAREDQAPDYCDDENVGLPEPDYPMPSKPQGLKLPKLPPG